MNNPLPSNNDANLHLFREQLAAYIRSVQARNRRSKSVMQATQRLVKQLQLPSILSC